MAEDKKGFLLYADLIEVVKKLPRKKAGDLFVHILEYVNDMNPTTDDLILQLTFEPIKQQLKRDLVKWERFRAKQSENGKMGGRPPKTQTNPKNPSLSKETQKSLTVTDNVTDNVNVNDTVIKNKKYIFHKALIDFGFDEKLVFDWMEVRKKKKCANTETAFAGFISEVQKSQKPINEILRICVEKSWGGFDHKWLNNNDKKHLASSAIIPNNNLKEKQKW